MARQILPEEQFQDNGQVTEEIIEVEKAPISTGTMGEETIITADEMNKLFHEWTANGQNNLYVNLSLAERIRKYLEYQEELDPLKEKLAERIYKPYLVEINKNTLYKEFEIHVNGKYITKECCYDFGGFFCIINVRAFKVILSSIGNPYAPYIPNSTTSYIDILGYVIANGGSYIFDNGYKLTI